MTKFSPVSLALCASLTLSAACGGGDDRPPPTDGGMTVRDGGPLPGRDGGPGALDCPGIFDCAEACGDDDPCIDACVDRGTPEAVVLAAAVVACAKANSCTDEDCLAANCEDELLACAGVTPPPTDGGVPDGGPSCSPGAGVPELTGALTGIGATYAPGATMTVGVPVDGDTRNARLSIYQFGSTLYVGGTAMDVTPSSVVTMSLGAGVAGSVPVGTYYLQVELCSTSVCTTPVVRNTYDRMGTSTAQYFQTRMAGGATEVCATGIPIQTFRIE